MILKNIEPSLNNIINAISNLTNLEFAIFDIKSHLVTCTKTYLKIKGSNVHSASIEEVINQGNVVVNKPGYMKSCIGCRFVNNCPSTIEILSCIKMEGNTIGVISLTTFTQEGHIMIEKNLSYYLSIIDSISNLISMFASNEDSKVNVLMIHKVMDSMISKTRQNYMITDINGMFIYWDKDIQGIFPNCNLFTQSIFQIFSEDIINWIFSTKKPIKKYIKLNTYQGLLGVEPLIIKDELVGYSLEFELEKEKKNNSSNYNYLDAIITNNDTIIHIKELILKISKSSSSVLITGETGTGKEMVAKAIHFSSNRKYQPFIPINCANIPEALFESELFGYEEGSFTGAKKGGKLGIFEMGNGGTIFLDEIGDLPLYMQAKLLRVLQEKIIHRLGSLAYIPIDIRLIAATNQNLEKMIADNKFREDLFYRINVINMVLTPLRERIADIEALAYHFIEKYNIQLSKNINSISYNALNILSLYNWPGNIRELENAIEYAVNIEDSNILHSNNLPSKIRLSIHGNNSIKDMVSEKEYNVILNALDKNGWDLSGKEKTSQELGMSLRTLYRKIKELGIMK